MIEIIEDNNVITCKFSGKFDSDVCAEVMPMITPLLDRDGRLVYDFADLDFIASPFFQICLVAYKKLHNNFSIINVPPMILKMFKITHPLLRHRNDTTNVLQSKRAKVR